jgi:hypothetical protein
MDPYLESRWGDVHTGLCAAIRAALQPHLPAGLRARAEERVLLSDDEGEPFRVRRGDAVIVETPEARSDRLPTGGVAVATPLMVEVPEDSPVHRWVQIIDARDGGRVVTVVEILSPWNKEAGRTNAEYVRKVEEYLRSDVNFVEIDLLRSSRRHLLVPDDIIPPQRRAPYLVCINRPKRRSSWALYPLPLREPLPAIPIPCRPTDVDVPLPLQPLIDQVYADGGHDDIDYAKPLDPPLSPDDQRWLDGLLAARRPA